MQPAAAAAILFLLSMGVTLNPDGSGKAVVEVRQPTRPTAGLGNANPPTPEMARKAARMVMLGAKGVDAWADVEIGVSPDALMTFKGTAYFSNIEGFAVAAHRAGAIPAKWTKDPKGGMVLSIDPLPGPPARPVQLAPDELAKSVEKAREDWKRVRAGVGDMAGFKHVLSFKLPGEPAEATGFKKNADGTLHFTYDAAEILAAFDKLMADEKYVSGAITAGYSPLSPGCPLFHESFFGARTWTARITGEMKPQFDYQAEVKAAKEAAPKMMEKLGLPAPAAGK
jgi:hypothetical protein